MNAQTTTTVNSDETFKLVYPSDDKTADDQYWKEKQAYWDAYYANQNVGRRSELELSKIRKNNRRKNKQARHARRINRILKGK